MPVYEYRCARCQHKMALFFRSPSAVATPACERCGSDSITRLFSTFAVHRSQKNPLDDGGGDVPFDESDPRSAARWMREMGSDMGEEMGPEFDEMTDRLGTGGGLDGEEDDFDAGEDDFAL